jgi:membrane-bound serine protease (ClpP class)
MAERWNAAQNEAPRTRHLTYDGDDRSGDHKGIRAIIVALVIMACLLVVLAIAAFAILHSAAKGKLFRSRLVLGARDLGDAKDVQDGGWTGKRGRASSALRPAGIADFDGERRNVVSEGAFIAEGTEIEVLREERGALVVRAVEMDGTEER